jgi:hypothetical protein
LLQDPDLARRLGGAGRRRADSTSSHEAMVRKIEAVYHAALGRPTAQGDASAE